MCATPVRPRLLEPGLGVLPPGTERYLVHGAGMTVVALAGGDRVEVVDREGRQCAEMVVFASAGPADAGILGTQATAPAEGIAKLLSLGGDDTRLIGASLARRGLALDGAPALHLFGPDSLPGERVSFTADREAVLIVAAPGGPMRADRQDPPTDLELWVHRHSIANAPVARLPDPLADPGVTRCTWIRAPPRPTR